MKSAARKFAKRLGVRLRGTSCRFSPFDDDARARRYIRAGRRWLSVLSASSAASCSNP